jgi:hypothetical protein
MAVMTARRSAIALRRAASPVAVARRRGRRRRTYAIAALAGTTTGAVLAAEVARVWRRGSAPLPAETADVLGAGAEATRQTVEVAVAGYRATPTRETALLNLLGSFVVSLALVRASTWRIRSRGTFGPFRELHVGDRHVHHFVPGIGIAFVAGALAIATRDAELEEWLAIPYGFGVALTLDESALLLELEDVYWTEQGVLSVQIALSAAALLASFALGQRLLRRGEERVLPAS